MKKKYTIAVAGTGYVGLSISVLLAQHEKVFAVDIVPSKVNMVKDGSSFLYPSRGIMERLLLYKANQPFHFALGKRMPWFTELCLKAKDLGNGFFC